MPQGSTAIVGSPYSRAPVPAVRTQIPRADHRYRKPGAVSLRALENLFRRGYAAHIQQQGSVRTFPEEGGVAGVEYAYEPAAFAAEASVFLLRLPEEGVFVRHAGAPAEGFEESPAVLPVEREHFPCGPESACQYVLCEFRCTAEQCVQRYSAYGRHPVIVHRVSIIQVLWTNICENFQIISIASP